MRQLSASEFEARLREVGESRYHHLHPFNQRMHAGELSREELRGWVINRFYYQVNLPIKDAYILSKLPSREDRRQWMTRIVDHDGRADGEGGIESWLRLGEAVGASRDELLGCRSVVPGARFAVDAYVNFCRTRPWLEAVASAMTELFAPDLIARRIDDMQRHYPWIEPAGLEYFRARLEQQPKDIEHMLGLVLSSAQTPEDQQRCVEALEFKCDVLWTLLDSVEQAYRKDTA
ncbi:MAG: pyrroloquinoline-quinone synthase PqqC [Propionibacteriales bacterium]|nr:pyrroloquinoline-quinone synthase PqqC [Propionibacteriales bacterium]